MAQRFNAMAIMLAVLLAAGTASAQSSPTVLDTPRLARWDVDGGIGLHLTGDAGVQPDTDPYQGARWGGSGVAAFRVGIGHYWTTHLKSEVGMSWIGDRSSNAEAPDPGVPSGRASVRVTERLRTFSASAVYQFRDNAFSHPYVSAGIAILQVRDNYFQAQRTFTLNRVIYTTRAIDDNVTTVLVRPVVAAGYKFYFNQRVYVRPEAQAVLGPDGSSHMVLRIGVGTDF